METDCVLIAILIMRKEMEKKTKEIASPIIENPKLKENSEIRNAMLEICIGILLSNFATSQPESGIPIIALAGMIISKFPKSSSERL